MSLKASRQGSEPKSTPPISFGNPNVANNTPTSHLHLSLNNTPPSDNELQTKRNNWREKELEVYSFQKNRLQDLFDQINQEFDLLWDENIQLRRRLEESNITELPTSLITEKPNFSPSALHRPHPTTSGKLPTVGTPPQDRNAPLKRPQKSPVPTWEPVGALSLHNDGIWEISACRWDSALFATASLDRTARVWSAADPNVLLMSHSGSVNSVRFHPTARLACTASGDRSCMVWKIPKREKEEKEDAPRKEVQDKEEERDPAKGKEERTSGKALVTIQHNNAIIGADWVASGDKFFSTGWDDKARLWGLETGKIVSEVKIPTESACWVTYVSSHPKENLSAICGTDGQFKIIDWRTTNFAQNVQAHNNSVSSVIFNPLDENMIISSGERMVKIWDRRNLTKGCKSFKRSAGINKISISPVSGYLALPLDDLRVRIFDLNGKVIGHMPQNFKLHKLCPTSTAWSNDQSVVFSVGFDAQINAMALRTRKV